MPKGTKLVAALRELGGRSHVGRQEEGSRHGDVQLHGLLAAVSFYPHGHVLRGVDAIEPACVTEVDDESPASVLLESHCLGV